MLRMFGVLLVLFPIACHGDALTLDASASAGAAKVVDGNLVPDEEIAKLVSGSTSVSEKCDVLIRLGWATPEDKIDLLRQESVFKERLPELRKSARGKWAVVVKETIFLADSYPDAMVIMEREGRGRQFFVAQIE